MSNQSINQPVNQSINLSNNQSIKQSSKQTINWSANQLVSTFSHCLHRVGIVDGMFVGLTYSSSDLQCICRRSVQSATSTQDVSIVCQLFCGRRHVCLIASICNTSVIVTNVELLCSVCKSPNASDCYLFA